MKHWTENEEDFAIVGVRPAPICADVQRFRHRQGVYKYVITCSYFIKYTLDIFALVKWANP